MKVSFTPLSSSNWEICAKLTVSDEQVDALPNNYHSIAELNFYPDTTAVAILNDNGTIVGFATYGTPVGERVSKIFRLMIDKQFQGKGYGKAALRAIVAEVFEKNDSDEIQVCYHPSWARLKIFYGNVGFVEKELLPCARRTEGKMLAILKREQHTL